MYTHLNSLTLFNFKNYEDASLSFCSKVNCITGNNGVGKTNILDAVFYLSLCKSYFGGIDSNNIRHENEFFVVQGEYLRENSKENIYCGLKLGQKKMFRRNGKEYERLADHIGLIPVVMVSPYDSNLIVEGSEERRKFTDMVISQLDQVYLDDLMRYNRTLIQRNQLLKDFARRNWFDTDMVEMWNEQLIVNGLKIFEKRKSFITEMVPVFQKYYDFVSGGNEKVDLVYESQLFYDDFKNLLEKSIDKDRAIQHTSVGIHKDDLILKLNGYPIKRVGSQGQQKTYLVALKLAQFDFISQHTQTKPILLLDDIFDKFDTLRVEKIVKLVSGNHFGQIFITDTHTEQMETILKQIDGEYRLFRVNNDNTIEVLT